MLVEKRRKLMKEWFEIKLSYSLAGDAMFPNTMSELLWKLQNKYVKVIFQSVQILRVCVFLIGTHIGSYPQLVWEPIRVRWDVGASSPGTTSVVQPWVKSFVMEIWFSVSFIFCSTQPVAKANSTVRTTAGFWPSCTSMHRAGKAGQERICQGPSAAWCCYMWKVFSTKAAYKLVKVLCNTHKSTRGVFLQWLHHSLHTE